MAAFNFITVDDRNFALNSRAYPSIYMARQFDNDPGFIEIVEKDNQFSHLIERERIGNISIDGKSDWSSAEELQVALNSQLKIGGFKSPGSGGGSGSGSASDVTVIQSEFETLSGANVQAVLNDIDDKLTEGIGIPEAPEDGRQYGRQDGSWTEITGSSDKGVPEAPEDGKLYGRQNGAWAEVSDTGMAVTYDGDGNILAGETLLGRYTETSEIWGNEATHTSIASFDRPEVLNPPAGVKQTITNPDWLTWADGNVDFKDPSPRGWRIPTREELIALDTAGRGAWTQLNGTNGRYFGGNGIFLPAVGGRDYYGIVGYQGAGGCYWSSSPASATTGRVLYFDSTSVYLDLTYNYAYGYAVRCVRDASTTDFEPCSAGEFQVGDIIWAKSNLSNTKTFAQNPEDYGAYFQWGQDTAIGGDGQPLSIRHKIAYLSDIPTPPPTVRFNVTNMFTFNPAVSDAKVWMRDDGQQKPEIEIIANNSSNNTNDLTIIPANGFGSWYDLTGLKAIQAFGKDLDSGASGIYDITITGETDQSQTIITVPKEVNNIDFIYFLGKTAAPKAGHYTDWRNIATPFGLSNTAIDNFLVKDIGEAWAITINGLAISPSDITNIEFGDSYKSVTEIPYDSQSVGFFVYCGGLQMLNISGFSGIINIPDGSSIFCDCSYLESLQIGSWDARNITVSTSEASTCFQYAGEYVPSPILYADSLELGNAFKDKFPSLSTFKVSVNP